LTALNTHLLVYSDVVVADLFVVTPVAPPPLSCQS
jgi:hypothetical protein